MPTSGLLNKGLQGSGCEVGVPSCPFVLAHPYKMAPNFVILRVVQVPPLCLLEGRRKNPC